MDPQIVAQIQTQYPELTRSQAEAVAYRRQVEPCQLAADEYGRCYCAYCTTHGPMTVVP